MDEIVCHASLDNMLGRAGNEKFGSAGAARSYAYGEELELCVVAVYTSTSLTMPDIGINDLDPLLQSDFMPVFNALRNCNVSIGSLVIALLTQRRFKKSIHLNDLLLHSGGIISGLFKHRVPNEARKAASEALQPIYAQEMRYLVKPTSGWHFSARTAIPDDVDDFEMDNLAMDIAENAPMLWSLLDVLLDARKRKCRPAIVADDGSSDMDLGNDRSGGDSDETLLEGNITPSPEQQKAKKSQYSQEDLLCIVSMRFITNRHLLQLPLEENCHCQYHDAEFKSKGKYISKRSGVLFAFLSSTREGH